MRNGLAPEWSTSAGIFELGLIETKPLPNWSPSLMRMSQASYSAPLCPASSSSSSITVALTPLGVASEYSWNGCLPTGSSLSWVGPAIGRLILANWPPFSFSHFQTFGGTYSVELMCRSPSRTNCGPQTWGIGPPLTSPLLATYLMASDTVCGAAAARSTLKV